MVARGTAVMNESELATLILRLLSHMAKIFPSRDVDGAIIRQLDVLYLPKSNVKCFCQLIFLNFTH